MKGLQRIALSAAAVALVAAGSLAVSGAAVGGDEPWFDMEHCSFCKNLTTDPELLHHMTWEQYNLSNGIVSITTVDQAYADSFAKAQAAMAAVAHELQQGKQLPLCHSCMAMGMIMMKGPKSERIETKNGEVWIMTSDDPAVVKQMQDWAAHNMAELAKMEAQGAE